MTTEANSDETVAKALDMLIAAAIAARIVGAHGHDY